MLLINFLFSTLKQLKNSLSILKSYISNFLKREGSYVLSATIIARILSFLASLIALKLIDKNELGIVLFAYNIILFLLPISGFGLHQSLIRFGALQKTKEEKDSLFLYVLKKGILMSLLFILLIVIISSCFSYEFQNTQLYIIILSFIIVPYFIYEVIRAQFRLQHNNKQFAYAEFFYSFILLLSISILSFFYKEFGYATALVITPLLTSILFIKKLKIDFSNKLKLNITDFYFWKYGFFASLSNVVTQLLFVIDILLIGFLLKNTELITIYRYISLIPFSLLFLPRAFIATDFVSFTEKIYNKTHTTRYIKSYMLFFFLMSCILFFSSLIFGEKIIVLLDEDFVSSYDTFIILIIGIIGIYIFRGLFGNLLSSIGKAHINYYISSFALIINISANYFLIPKYGLNGAAITTSVLMWFTGLLSMIVFFKLYSKILSKK